MAQTRGMVAATYLKLGIEHILLGFDHLLFVLALLIITQGSWRLVKTGTSFTVAHSITLALATLGFVHVPSPPVEAVIALSIAFVAGLMALALCLLALSPNLLVFWVAWALTKPAGAMFLTTSAYAYIAEYAEDRARV